ncbi:MAG TPA: PrgI family protein [Candidatus Saccharimonadales bacterium]|nr:PrgI family protein [Candidatus Saccharimonadales bacterium]
MAAYKVIQDVEAEDKLLGPLTLRQFIYAGAAALMLYLCYFAATHHATLLVAVFLPMAIVLAFFAFPWGRDQPTEIWALAKIRFLLKPRRRIWDQSGAKDLVSVTAPKQVQVNYTNGLSETEVRSRLHALADTIDSRGWAIKNANLNLYTQPALVIGEPTSDRLVAPSALPQQVSDVDVGAADDILDEKNNARAQAVDTMIERSAKAHRDQIVENLRQTTGSQAPQQAAAPQSPQAGGRAAGPGGQQEAAPGDPNYRSNDYWFLNQPARSANIPANMVTFNTQVVTPGMGVASPGASAPMPAADADEQNLARALAAKQQEMPTTAYYSHLHTIQPLSAQQPQPAMAAGQPQPQTAAPMPAMPAPQLYQPGPPAMQFQASPAAQPIAQPQSAMPAAQPTIARPWEPANPAPAPVTPANQAAILQLANNNDLNVATLAREADRATSDEVVINLH